jgi:ABC-2 type transport system permease protein
MTSFTATGRLFRLALRRDQVQLPVWILSLTALHAVSVWSVIAVYGDNEERLDLLAGSAVSGVALMFNGLVSGSSVAAAAMSQTLLLMLTATALMSTFAVVRHSRQNEETQRAELVGAAVVGRRAPLTAALSAVALADVAVGLLNAFVLVAAGFPAAGSVLVGAALALTGIVFGSIAAVTAQVASTARAANGLAGAAIALAFALRGLGDMFSRADLDQVRVHSSWPSWLSPIGWAQQIRPYDEDQWVLLIPLVVFAAVLVAVAFQLLAHRDVGAGMIATRPGPGRAEPGLLSPVGLAWRLQRNVLYAWGVAIAILGTAYGAMAPELEDLVGSSESTREILEHLGGSGDLIDVYLAAVSAMGGLGVAAYTVQALLRVRGEETAGTLEAVVTAGVSRTRFLFSHVTVVAAGTIGLLVLYGATMGLTYGLTGAGAIEQLGRYTWAGLLQAPAALALGGVAVAVFGLAPGASRAVAWAAYVACLVLGQLGELLGLPGAVLGVSPFSHLPAVPVEPAELLPVVTLTVIAAAATILGADALRRRDLRVV